MLLMTGYTLSQDSTLPGEIYKSDNLIISRISENTYVHTSFKQTNDYGNVPCNGMIAADKNEVIVFDTPINDSAAEELITWIAGTLNSKIVAVIPTHFHDDCLGGLNAFIKRNIPSYANHKTIELARLNNFAIPEHGFIDSLKINLGNEYIVAMFPGEGHTIDNIVGYFPAGKVLFGGCLIKEINASKGYLGDANVTDWSAAVERVKSEFPDLQIVVPGHGDWGDKKLLDYTIKLFRYP